MGYFIVLIEPDCDVAAALQLLARTDGWLVDGRPIGNSEMDSLRKLKAYERNGSNMVNVNEYFDSNYIKASDLQRNGKPAQFELSIHHVEEKMFEGEDRPVLIVYFRKTKKGLRLNRTNAMAISQLYGPETAGWLGKRITLTPDMTTFMGRPCPCVRVVLAMPGELQTVVPADEPGFGPGPEDDGAQAPAQLPPGVQVVTETQGADKPADDEIPF